MKIKTFLLILLAAISLCGCHNAGTDGTEVNYDYLKDLEYDTYYVRHVDNECEAVYFGQATFDYGATTDYAADDRVMWFKEDFENIPTLYAGDSLILCTQSELTEEFIFERFEDFGYSIGINGLTETTSGRYSLSTNPDDCNTYPEGDTDEILLLKNETVIIDTLGGRELRAPMENDYGEDIEENHVTRCGTIKGLTKDNNYKAEIYEGTLRNEYVFKANVKILGSMEVVETTDYIFESMTIINIKIPEYFNTGYYMINGSGIFRYVNDVEYSENTNFNIPNEVLDDGNNNFSTTTNGDFISTDNISVSTFTIETKGEKRVVATISGNINSDEIEGYVVDPEGDRYEMDYKAGKLEVNFEAENSGEYTIEIINLNNAEVTVKIIE